MESRISRHAPPGFTLIEAVIAIVVLGVMLAVGIPPTTAALQRSRVDRAARVVATDLRLAFSMAARQRRPIRVTFDPINRSHTFSDATDGTVLRTRLLGDQSEYRLSAMTVDQSAIDVFPTGVASAPVTLTLTAGGYTRQVSMMRAGLVRVVR